MNEKILNLISRTISVKNVFTSLDKFYNIIDGGGYGDNQLFNFYFKDGNRGMRQIFININKNINELTEQETDFLYSLFP